MKVAASNVKIKIHQRHYCTAENLRGLDTNWPLNNVLTILVIMIIKLILICLRNLFSNFFINMKNEKRTVFRFPFFYEIEKWMKVLKIQRKNPLKNLSMNFVFFIDVKAKSKYRTSFSNLSKTRNGTLSIRICKL